MYKSWLSILSSHITLFQQQTPPADKGWLNLLAVQQILICVSKHQNAFQWKAKQLCHFSPPASPITVHALCSFREYYNAAVACTRCLTPFLLRTPSNQHLLWQGSHVHSIKLIAKASCSKRPTCNCAAEEEQRSTGQSRGHFCLAMGVLSQPLARNGAERHKWPCDGRLWGDPTLLSLENSLPGSPGDYRFAQAQEPEKRRCLSNLCLFYAVALQIPLTLINIWSSLVPSWGYGFWWTFWQGVPWLIMN